MVRFDGRLYNREPLLTALSLDAQATDETLVARAYAKWGADCPSKLDGVFALAVETEDEVFLARDPLGIKRLFYNENDAFDHAFHLSELAAAPRLGQEGIAELLLLGPGRTPGGCVLSGAREVLPGGWARQQKGKALRRGTYWKPRALPHTHSFEETVARVRDMIKESIRRQAASDGRVCAFLSGGLDSGAITALSGVGQTFSVDYEGNAEYFTPSAFQPQDDRAYIQMMTDFLGTKHDAIVLDTEELADALFEAADARGLPGMGDVDASLLLFCRRVRERADVALSGEGADELFGGYPWYGDTRLLREGAFPWSRAIDYRAGFAKAGVWEGLDPAGFVRERCEQALAETDGLPDEQAPDRRMRQMFMLHLGWFGQTLLERHDRMGHAAGLEVRMPYCDSGLAQYLYNVPWEYKHYRGREKGLLREALRGWLPEEVLWRKKSPYPKTHNPAYEDKVAGMMRELLHTPNAPLFDLLDKGRVAGLLDGTGDDPPWYGQLMTRPQTIAYFLQINHWLKKRGVTIEG